MSRTYKHRYKVLSGSLKGMVTDGQQIGVQDYPEQFIKEGWDSETINAFVKKQHENGVYEGIWLDEPSQTMHRPLPIQGGYRPKIEFTDEGVNYDDVYMDLCVPFDRYGNEISVGDTLMIASRNEVRRVEVIKIAKKPFMASYGIMNRKLTVRDNEEEQTLTINDPRATVKV
jgi:hypothetical protein